MSPLQISLFPGISTNGLKSGEYNNDLSFNIFGGIAGSSRIIELGLLTNLDLKSSTGIQIGGIANVIGSNRAVNLTLIEERVLIDEGLKSNMKGIQFAGIMNFILNDMKGIQLTGGLNMNGGDFTGVRFAGLGNSTGGSSRGYQMAGVYNVSEKGVIGIQVAALINSTGGGLNGIQVAIVNRAEHNYGRNSTPPTRARSLQIGLVNISRQMEGTQIGLINIGGRLRGTQIGLINIFKRYPSKEHVRHGTPVGLLNFGSKGSFFRMALNEVFPLNIEYTTGNCLNCSWTVSEMPVLENGHKIFNQNALILGYDPILETWGFGWGFQKVLYNKVSVSATSENEKRALTYGFKLLHLNRDMSIDRDFNLLNRFHFEFGRRIGAGSFYIFTGASINIFAYNNSNNVEYKINSKMYKVNEFGRTAVKFWPGYTIGIQFL